MQNRQECFGVPQRNKSSYFRTWGNSPGVASSSIFYGAYNAGTSGEVYGTALSLLSDDSVNGTRVLVNEAGLYYASFMIKYNTNATALWNVVRFNPSYGTSLGSYLGTTDEICSLTGVATGTRYNMSGIKFLNAGDIVQVLTQVANAIAENHLYICKLG